ncbi:MAG: hypothetical protein Fues2KO_47040 [Fuerstiella sp.]
MNAFLKELEAAMDADNKIKVGLCIMQVMALLDSDDAEVTAADFEGISPELLKLLLAGGLKLIAEAME